ncbi:MAG: DUF2235 domain-containing protein [Verrucomicrobiota bacterium]|nr:DUF2235 domain-containing protein [Verrucomicrobiota bacterium]
MNVAYGYDAASRYQTISEGSLSQTYGYANYTGTVESQTFKRNTTTVLTTAQPRDSLGRLKTITHQATGFGSGFGYSLQYNDMNQITRRTETGGAYRQYGYDGLGQVTSAVKNTAADTIIPGYQYGFTFDDIGNRKTTDRNGRSATYTPNSRNQYTQRTVPGAVDALGEANASATVTVNGAATTRTGTLFFGIVTANNNQLPIWQPMNVVGTLVGAGTNGTDAISEENGFEFIPKTPEVFAHDADGNLTEDGRWTYEWDAENRPIRMTTRLFPDYWGIPAQKLEYAYDSQGRRIWKKVYSAPSGTTNYQLLTTSYFLYDSWNLLQELKTVHGTPNTTSASRFVWGLDASGSLQGAGGVGGLLWIDNATDAEDASREGSYFTAFDHNGNLAALVNSTTGAIAASYEYGPFGETLRANGPMAAVCPFQFSTKYLDAETGLYYYGNRYYNPRTGSWVSRDPIEEKGGLNLYTAISNNPISLIDPYGLNLYAIDGTGADEAVKSNVYKFYTRYKDGPKYYYRGPGNPTDGNKALGPAWGAGASGIVKSVVAQICKDYAANKTINIDIIGFSRGSAIANEIATTLDENGCQCKRVGNFSRNIYDTEKPKVRFLGLYDPVYSFPLIQSLSWNDDTIPKNVQNASTAYASDEKRSLFRAVTLEPASNVTKSQSQWFPGVHSDVGGTTDRNLYIGAMTLRWMVDQARTAGVNIDDSGLPSDSQLKQWEQQGFLQPFDNVGPTTLLTDK